MGLPTGQNDDEVMSTINITPFTDVLLVLLIIFIILASVTRETKLPDARNRDKVQESQIVVVVDDRNRVQIGSRQYAFKELPAAFKSLADQTGHKFTSVIIRSDPHADYGTILRVMDAAKEVDLTNFGLANHVEGEKS
jgi:biopolymer transport protein TolR